MKGRLVEKSNPKFPFHPVIHPLSAFRKPAVFRKPFAIIGHRGAAGHAPENSLEAFEIAFEARVDGIELDVKNIHNNLIVFHDDNLLRLTSQQGEINQITQSAVADLQLANGESIPSLYDVWEITPPNIPINVELKGPNTAKLVCEFMKKHSHRYLVSSFLIEELRQVQQLTPEVPRALLARERRDTTLALADELDVCNVHIMDRIAEPSVIRPLLNAGFHVFVFTVNEVERANKLQRLGVSAIFTDVPRLFFPR